MQTKFTTKKGKKVKNSLYTVVLTLRVPGL